MTRSERNRIAFFFTLLIVIISAPDVRAIPETISISGNIEDASGNPVEGEFAAQVVFYPTENATGALDVHTDTITLVAGVFDFQLIPSTEVIAQNEIWYSLAIDLDGNGFDLMDLFEDRFRITSVPFAISARPAQFFATHGGHRSGGGTGRNDGFDDRLQVAPFLTPGGGVRFDKMTVFAFSVGGALPEDRFMFGIFDDSGESIAVSGVFEGQVPGLLKVSASGFLRPSSLYYTAWGGLGRGPLIKEAIVPDLPQVGFIPNIVTGGAIPDSFNPEDIVFSSSPIALSVTLTYEAVTGVK